MASNFEFVQHPRRVLPPPIPQDHTSTSAILPGTFHPINPKKIAAGNDQILLSGWGKLVRWLAVLVAVLTIMIGINLILDGVYGVGTTSTNRLYLLAQSPIIGLLIGILATSIVQSSTTTTTLTVAAVGTGIISVPIAIPIIMGANIGTTITALLVSFSYVGEREEFRKAFTTAAMHLWLNVLTVLFLLPIEMLFQPLGRASELIAELSLGVNNTAVPTTNLVESTVAPFTNLIGMNGLFGLVGNETIAAILCLSAGTLIILLSIRIMSFQLRMITAATVHSLMDTFAQPALSQRAALKTNLLGFGFGAIFTMMVSASSVTVSSMQPFAVTKTLSRRMILAVIVGADVGTTLTALLATFAIVGDFGVFALQAALVHVFINVFGALLVLFVPQIGQWIIRLSQTSANLAARSYSKALFMALTCYLILPALIILGFGVLS